MFKALLKTRLAALFYSFTRGSKNKKGHSALGKAGIALLFIYVVGCMMWLFGSLWESMCEPFYRLGLAWLYFAFVGITTLIICFVGSVFMAQQQLFAAKDNDLLLSMPIPPRAIVASRMLMLIALSYLTEALIVLPAAYVWLVSLPVTAAGVVIFALAFLALPMISLTLSCLFGYLIEAVTSRLGRGKNLFTMIISIAFLALYFVFYSRMQEYISVLITNGAQIGDAIRTAVPPLYWLGNAVASHDAGQLLLFLVCCILPFGAAYALISRSFIFIATRRTSGAKRVYRRGDMKVASADRALFSRELSHFLSSAMYMMNAGLGLVMLLIGVVALVIKSADIGAFVGSMGFDVSLMCPILCVAELFILSMVIISAPTISLEGRNLWIAQSLPVPSYNILRAKVRLHSVISIPFALCASVAIAVISGADALSALGLIALPAAFILLTARLGVLINLRLPRFDWTNETVAVKQSMATVIAMFANMALVVAAAFGYALTSAVLDVRVYMLIVAALFAVLSLIFDRLLKTSGSRRFESLA